MGPAYDHRPSPGNATGMIRLQVELTIDAAVADVFALALDPERFPPLFRGCGPVPGLLKIVPQASPAVGALRDVYSADGSCLQERITELQPPHRHAYRLSGLRPPLAWLVRGGQADWSFAGEAQGTRVIWRYDWHPSHALAWPLAWLLLQGCLRIAMRRCLRAMAGELAATRKRN